MAQRVLVTGGAGFIGSHLVDKLVEKGFDILVLDNFVYGSRENLTKAQSIGNVEVVYGDILDFDLLSSIIEKVSTIYHLAALPEVRFGQENPKETWSVNVEGTKNLLEAMKEASKAYNLIFASTSTVYGDSQILPTPEDYGPLKPISFYGASKLAAEAIISAYSFSYGFRSAAMRLANIVGARGTHGIIPDFIRKLRVNPDKLEVLGDGKQRKSYLHVSDCISALVEVLSHLDSQFEAYNVGSDDSIEVSEIAKIVVEEMKLSSRIIFTGGVGDGRGWLGDVKVMQLSNRKLKSIGWSLKYGSESSIRLAVRELLSKNQ
ncbi:MAG: NAD-dependent epimerase/dehydratase family protein [Thermoproteota archaeon]